MSVVSPQRAAFSLASTAGRLPHTTIAAAKSLQTGKKPSTGLDVFEPQVEVEPNSAGSA
jgi:hypothetical protein